MYAYTCRYISIHIPLHTCIHVYTYTYADSVYIDTYIHTNTRARTHTHARARTHTHTHRGKDEFIVISVGDVLDEHRVHAWPGHLLVDDHVVVDLLQVRASEWERHRERAKGRERE